jgi:hypothetical protein
MDGPWTFHTNQATEWAIDAQPKRAFKRRFRRERVFDRDVPKASPGRFKFQGSSLKWEQVVCNRRGCRLRALTRRELPDAEVCTPEALEQIDPGRAQHAPGEWRLEMESAPRQGVRRFGKLQPLPG